MQSERFDYALNMLLEGEDINLLKKHAERISEDYRDGTGPSKRIVNDAKKAKLLIHGDFIIGLPGETDKTAKSTFNFINEIKPDILQVS
ncbi:MAG TPA: hypothetical protein PKJ65_01165, partial [Clostridia bacterium]|nr:hypothetical protein [Clostridia bacterium]